MKKCPFCAESIQDEAVKCRWCNEFLTERRKPQQWLFKPQSVVIAFLCVGPFALPLVWKNPKLSLKAKQVITAVVILLTIVLGIVFLKALSVIKNYYDMMFESLGI